MTPEKYNGLITLPDKRVIEVGKMYPDIPNHIYHGSLGLGSTSLKNMNPEHMAPANFKAYKDRVKEFKGSQGSRIGSALHALTFSPLTWEDEIRTFPRRLRVADKHEHAKENPGYTWVDDEDLDTAKCMHPILMSQPEMARMWEQTLEERSGVFAGGYEQSAWYNDLNPFTGDSETFMLCKYRPDIFYTPEWVISPNTWLGDLKVTNKAGAKDFKRTIEKFGYHISAAHYMAGHTIVTGRRPGQWRWIVQEYDPPYLCAFYGCGEKTMKAGEHLRRKALDTLYRCKKEDNWPHYGFGKASIIDLPDYYVNKILES